MVEVSPPFFQPGKNTQKHGTTNVSPPPKAQVFLNSKESNPRLDTSVGTVVDDENEKIGQKGELDGGNSHICYFHPKPWGK